MKAKVATYLKEAKETYLNLPISIRAPHGVLRVNAIIDTGSPKTIIGYEESRRLQIPFNESASSLIRLGGGAYQMCEYDKIKLILEAEDQQRIEEQLPIKIIKPTSAKEIPSGFSLIIGTDFLKDKGYKLFCDIRNSDAYLEK